MRFNILNRVLGPRPKFDSASLGWNQESAFLRNSTTDAVCAGNTFKCHSRQRIGLAVVGKMDTMESLEITAWEEKLGGRLPLLVLLFWEGH